MRMLLFGLLLLPLSGIAQEKEPQQKQERPPYTIKIAPAALLNFIQQAVIVQADIPLSARWGLDMGAGVVLNSLSFATFQGESYKGLKLRPAVKYYMKGAGTTSGYVSFILKYNNLYSDRYVNTIRQGSQYTEWLKQRRHIVTYGVSLQFGTQEFFGKRKRWFIEPFIGAGIRYQHITRNALPGDAEFVSERGFINFERDPGNYTLPDFMMGVYLGMSYE